ncbi:cupin domain-containing protein [Parachitinimonas caeni]|uniref:Cupin domain-containing protein n=1 Tax=Parachitinimonas caeni TaxID=3031301 RepID=A0ABT7DV24_9NEIS|nr:cupin domain-containing protein [Parachitinimonas caeni]MDK2123898.1 cupin domain-containing protein [Parachitinimonas caeni]
MENLLQILHAEDSDRFVFEGFESLIAPIDSETFFKDYWEKRAFFIKRAKTGYFDSLLSLADIDQFIGTRLFRKADIRIAKQGKIRDFEDFSKDGAADRGILLNEFANGSTLVFEHLNRHHAPLAHAIYQCEADLHVPFRSNIYLTPAQSQGFAQHWDTHDVLILQVHGKKTWQVFDSPMALPHEAHKFDSSWTGKANLLAEITLEPGDVLFLPRGFVHSASTSDGTSLHITIGMRSLTLGDVATRAFEKAVKANVAMRKVALFREYQDEQRIEDARALLHDIVEGMDIRAALDEVYCSFIRSRFPPLDGRLLALTEAEPITHTSALKIRAGSLYQTFLKDETLRLAVDGKVVVLPRGVEEAIGYMQNQPSFTPADLPGLEQESKLILSRRLVQEGLLEPA